ncbi:MAG: hypothetical protein IJ327_03995 [Lachnospiraceae bacterium]|nr:hypothetical protein [Lachnospiraceae bacterium]
MKFTKQNDALGRAFLFGGLLTAGALPYILHTVILTMTERSLSDFAYGFCNVLGGSVAVAMIYLALGFMGMTKLWDYISCMLTFFWAMIIMELGRQVLFPKLTTYTFDHVWLMPVIYAVLVLLSLFFLAMAALNGLRKPLQMLLVMLMWGGYALAQLLVQKLLELCTGLMEAAFLTNLVMILVSTIVDTLVIYGILVYARKVTDNWQRKEYSVIYRNVPFVVVIVIALVACGVQKSSTDTLDVVVGDLQEDLLQGDLALFNENLEFAITFYERALNRMDMWQFVFNQEVDVERLKQLVNSKEDLQLCVLYWEKTGDLEAMENYLLYDAVNMDLAIKYLDMMAIKADGGILHNVRPDAGLAPEELQKRIARTTAIKKDIMSLMIANNYFQNNTIAIADVTESKEELLEVIAEYKKAQISRDVLQNLAETGKTGEVTQDRVNQMLDYAESLPENMFLQRMAVVYGNALKGDNAPHYGRTVQAAIRYEKLFASSSGVTESDRIQCKVAVAQWIMNMKDYTTALTYLEDVLKTRDNVDAVNMAAQCYNHLGQADKCREMTEKLLQMEPDNIQALTYCAMAYLKSKDRDKALEYSIRICEVMEQSQGEEKHAAEVALFSMLQYLTLNDNSTWTGYQYGIYHKLDEAQMEVVQSNQLFYDYIEAVYLCFNKKSYQEALERINAVLGAQGELSQALYLKGAICQGAREYEAAVEAYKASIKVEGNSATVWYTLATCYDALERYEEAYEACLMTESLLPETDHGFDWYGVAIHNGRLKSALKRALGR